MDLRVVSAGDDIKIWDCQDFLLTKQLNPHDQNVSSVCWSHDNLSLASVSAHDENIVLTNMKGQDATLHCGVGCMCIDMNDSSRYMLSGGSDGIISVWDIKSRKVRKTYKDHKGPVTCARFNHNTTSIASGSETGEIILYNVVTGQGCRPLTAPNIQAIKQVQYSHHKKSMLGSVSDDGSVNLWDTNTRQMVHSFACHRAPATGLSFSPINDIFLMSVGLDKRIACHDVQTKKVVKIMSADSPLTSIDTMCDGVTVAVGSTRGKIYHYDLRMGSLPLRTVDAHKSSVQCLRFQTDAEFPGSNKSAAVGSKQAKSRQLPQSPRTNKDISESVSGASTVSEGRPYIADIGEDVFSPVREGYLDHSNEEMDYRASGSSSSFTNLTLANNRNSTGDTYAGGVFSPLNDNTIGRGSSGAGLSPLAYNNYSGEKRNNSSQNMLDYNRLNSQATTPIIKVIHPSTDTEEKENTPTYSHVANHSPQSNHVTSDTSPSHNFNQSSSINVQDKQNVHTNHKHVAFANEEHEDPYAFLTNNTSSSSETSNSPEMKRQRHTNQKHIGMSASPSFPSIHLDDSPGSVAGGTNSGVSSRHYTATTPDGVNAQSLVASNVDSHSVGGVGRVDSGRGVNVHNRVNQDAGVSSDMTQIAAIVRSVVQEELGTMRRDMRTVVRDEIDDMTEQLHKDIITLQAEMLRQFQIHQSDMMSLLDHYSVNHDLVSEVNILREEVKRLKKNF